MGFVIYSIFLAIYTILPFVGEWAIFKKCGKKGWHAIVPFLNYYELGCIADCEKIARRMIIVGVGYDLTDGIIRLFDPDNMSNAQAVAALVLIVSWFVFLVMHTVYGIQIYCGICDRFQRSRKWVFLWIFLEPVAALIFGFNKNFVPLPEKEKEVKAAEESGIEAVSGANDLSVNIRSRTARDFIYTKTLLRDIHLTIPKGHMVLLLGGSGAGKTTFLNAVTGYEPADADIEIGKGNVYKDYESMKYDIGFVPQLDLMRGTDTVYNTVADAATLRLPKSMTAAERKKRVEEVIERFGLAFVQKSLVEKLSGGQRKRLSIAMEFISDPTLFILDEPDSGLDGIVARSLFESLRAIADQGKIVIVITHTPDRVIDLFDDVIVLAKDAERTGRLAYYGPVDEAYKFFEKEKIEQILLSINQTDEGGEGKADYYVNKYAVLAKQRMGAVVL